MARKPDVDSVALAALVRRAFGTSLPVHCERTPDGVSTQVYRLVPGPATVYLRGAEEAGGALAVIHQVAVDGFGWLHRRGRGWPLRAEHASYLSFLTSYLPADWPGPLGSLLSGDVLATVEAMLDSERARPPAEARLAH